MLHRLRSLLPPTISTTFCSFRRHTHFVTSLVTSHRPRSTFTINPPPTVPFPTQPGDSPYPPPHQSTLGDSAALSLGGEANIIAGPPWPSIHSSPLPIDASPTSDVAAALQNILSTAMFSHSPEGNKQQDIATSNNAGMSSTRPTPARVPASAPPVPNTSSASWDAYPASTSNFIPVLQVLSTFPSLPPIHHHGFLLCKVQISSLSSVRQHPPTRPTIIRCGACVPLGS
jgi:hypothetical protein